MSTEPLVFKITKRQLHFGITSGEYGNRGYEWQLPHSDQKQTALYGVPLDVLVGEELGDGTTLEVTVRVIRRRKLTKNPWLSRRRRHYRVSVAGRGARRATSTSSSRE